MTVPTRPQDFQSHPTHDALTLTNMGKSAQIVLNDMVYTLSITKAGKLILTK